MQGLRPLFLLRLQLAPKQAGAGEETAFVPQTVNVLFSAPPHLPAVYQPVMWITQKKMIFQV